MSPSLKKPTRLELFFLIGIGILFIQGEAKELNPALFGGVVFQTSTAVLAALSLSIGLFLSLRAVLDRTNPSRRYIWHFLVYVLVYAGILTVYSSMVYTYERILQNTTHLSLDSTLAPEIRSLSKITELEKREQMAAMIYRHHGLIIPFMGADQQLATRQPTEDDMKAFQKSQKLMKDLQDSVFLLERQRPQLYRLVAIYLGTLGAVFVIGAIIVTLKKKPVSVLPSTP